MKKLISLLLALALVLSILPATLAAPAEKGAEDIVILYTNDVHTYIDKTLSYDNIADMKTTLAAENAGVLLVDAGDHIQGTAFGSMDKGETIIKLMNAAGYDLATLGNHEFDYGMERALELVGKAEFPYVSANFYHEKDGVKGETVLDAYQVFEIGGKKIALIGITTPESFTKSTPAYFQDEEGNYIYGIAGGTDGAALYADVQAAIDAASAEADYVIALGHCGDDPASKPWTSEEVIANTTGLDAFIDGHSHSTVPGKEVTDKGGNAVLLTQTGEYFGAIGKMTISASGITTELVTEWTGSNADVAAIKTAWTEEVNTLLGEVIGSTELTLDNYDAEGNRMVRKYETNTGDFCADALYWLFDSMDMDVDVAIMNGGGVRNKAVTGEISYLTCKNIHTFGNVACLQTVTGQQIIDALEWGARQSPLAEVGGFLQVSGITYKVDSNTETTVQMDDKGVWTGGPTGEYRVHDVKIYDKETNAYVDLDPEAKYNMAGYNYTLRDLGDGFAMFNGAVNVLDYVSEDYQVLATYVKAFENGKIEATNSPLLAKYPGMLLDYGTVNGSGRIEVSEYVEPWDGIITIGGLEPNLWTTKYGNVYTDCSAEHFTEDLGLAWGDLATVKFLDQELVLPVVPDYSYVDSGKPALLLGKNEQGNPTGYAFMAINMGNFLDTYGIAYKGTDADGNWYWTAYEGVEFPIVVTFELYEKEGYMAEYLLHELHRTNSREDYADLTDEEFANFREVTTTGMGDDTLYRSSSPINPELGRNTYADAAMEAAGIKTVINLADSETSAAAYPGFAETYYSQQRVLYLNLGVDFAAADFQEGLANGLRFMAANEGPYLVHCTEGKDRAGFVNALLECFMGATYEEVVADYMVTYYNYYGVEPGTDKYNAIANSNIIKSLKTAFGVEDLTTADLAAEAEEYLRTIGLGAQEVANLYVALGGEIAVSEDIVILYTNDVHTYIDKDLSYDTIADLKQALALENKAVLLIDAGDHIQGTAYGSMDKGATIIELMNAAGYDLATLGNHEFDYGMDGTMNVIDWANFPYVSANFYHEKDGVKGETVLDAYQIFEIDGVKIAIIGITTPESFTKSTPAYFQDEEGNYIYGISGGEDGAALYADVQAAIDAAKADGADYIIALGHLGDDPASQPWTSEELIANTTGLDAFIDGHSHSTVAGKEVADKEGNPVLLTQTGEYFDAIGKMTISEDGISTELITEHAYADAEVKAIKDAWIAEIETQLGEVIGYAEVTFDNYVDGGRIVRKQETNTGDFAADALYYLFDNMGLDVDVAIMNGGGVRNKAITGEMSYLTCKNIHTFGNVACLQTITGQQLLDALEW
ncbi:MAG: 5'-nucleotidase C-terminal domain-containing protein, partial [Oscillospiraceae bacterium]|nr:5'-nucleotidase C-terminal domain-containing protein [Oscillospiraceae bacterium]